MPGDGGSQPPLTAAQAAAYAATQAACSPLPLPHGQSKPGSHKAGTSANASNGHRGAEPCTLFPKFRIFCKVCVWQIICTLCFDKSILLHAFCTQILTICTLNFMGYPLPCILFFILWLQIDSLSADFMHSNYLICRFLQTSCIHWTEKICLIQMEHKLRGANVYHSCSWEMCFIQKAQLERRGPDRFGPF